MAVDDGAGAAGEVAILTWNLQGAAGVDVDAVAAVIAGAEVDVVALQEVQRRQARSLAARLQVPTAPWVFKHWPVRGPAEGLAVLSPHPMVGARRYVVRRRAPWSWRRRVALRVEVAAPAGPLVVVVVHLSPGDARPRRRAEAERVLAHLGADGGTSAFVAGDLNDGPDEGAHQALLAAGFGDGWALAPVRAGVTSGATNWTPGPRRGRPPTQRIDHVLVPPGWTVTSAEVGGAARPTARPPGEPALDRELATLAALSDHLPLVVRARRDGPR